MDRCWHASVSFYIIIDEIAEAAKPSYQDKRGLEYETAWNDAYIDELKRGLAACRVFLFYPIYWVAYSQMMNNFVSQGEDRSQESIDEARHFVDIDTSWYYAIAWRSQ